MRITGVSSLQTYQKYSANTSKVSEETVLASKQDRIEISKEGREAARFNINASAVKSENIKMFSNEEYLDNLQEQVPYIKLQIGYGININNDRKVNIVDINPKLLEKMKNDPKAAEEYTHRLKDVENAQKIADSVIKSMGCTVVCSHSYIDENGKFSNFTITMKKDLSNEKLRKEAQEKTEEWIEKSHEKTAEMMREKLEHSESGEIFFDNDDIQIIIDESKSNEGEPIEKTQNEDSTDNTAKEKRTVAFNAAKRARQLAAASTSDLVQKVLDLLDSDLSECEDGLSKGWCDENEVNKVKAMIRRAKERMSQVSREEQNENKDDNSNLADLAFAIASLM